MRMTLKGANTMAYMRNIFVGAVLAFLATLPWAGNSPTATIFSLELDSEPGDFIGQGLMFSFDENSPGTLSVFTSDFTSDGFIDRLRLFFLGDTLGEFWGVTLGTAAIPANLLPGVFEDAQRAPFAEPGHPGLEVFLNGRGCNRVTGRFEVNEAVFSDSNVVRFNAIFEQHCEGLDPALFGTLSIGEPRVVPEPSTLLLLCFGLAGLGLMRRSTKG